MELDPLYIMGLIILVTVIPAYRGWNCWQEHKSRRQAVESNGWRYSDRGWRMFFSSTYSLAGTTPHGVVWHFRRIQKGQQWLFLWSANNSLLPYGTFRIQPRKAAALLQEDAYQHLRHVAAGSPGWRESYSLTVTHNVLGDRFFSAEVEDALSDWPNWPDLGALEEVIWTKKELVVRARYKNDWPTVNRVVFLGTALVENACR